MRGGIVALLQCVIPKKALAHVQIVLNAGDADRPGRHGLRPVTDVHSIAVNIQDASARMLQNTTMQIKVGAQVDVGQGLGRRKLLTGDGRHGLLDGHEDLGILGTRQCQRCRQFNRRDFVFNDQLDLTHEEHTEHLWMIQR